METISVAAKLPYPTVEGIYENYHDLQLIYNDYAGQVSEFSAIAQYVYHQLEADREGFGQIGRTLLSIAQVEMRHLNLLGMAVSKLGGIPQFFYQKEGCIQPWRGDMIDDCRLVEMMLRRDLQLERQTIACYRWQRERVSQGKMGEILERIILDEEIHVAVLEQLLTQL